MSDPHIVMRYVRASRGYDGPLIAVQADLERNIVKREAALPLEYGVKGRELMAALRKGAEKFIRAMELQGLELIPLSEGNPQVVTLRDGRPMPTFSMTHDLTKTAPDELIDAKTAGGGVPTWKIPTSLEMSQGTVDYRILGVFWAPQAAIEVARTRQSILDRERAEKNPTVWGGGSSTPNRPSIAR